MFSINWFSLIKKNMLENFCQTPLYIFNKHTVAEICPLRDFGLRDFLALSTQKWEQYLIFIL